MIKQTGKQFKVALGKLAGRSVFHYAQKYLKTYKVKNGIKWVNALHVENVITLLKEHKQLPSKKTRYPSIWFDDYDNIMPQLEAWLKELEDANVA